MATARPRCSLSSIGDPLEHTTFDISLPFRGSVRTTILLTPKAGGTRVTVRTAQPTTANPLTQALLRVLAASNARVVHDGWVDGLKRLQALAAEDPAAKPPAEPSIAVAAADALHAVVGARIAGMPGG